MSLSADVHDLGQRLLCVHKHRVVQYLVLHQGAIPGIVFGMEPNTRYRTIGATFVANLTHNLLATLVLIAIGVAGVATQETVFADRPDVAGSSAQLFNCDPVPAGEFPSAAVVRKVNGATTLVTRPALVSRAFDVAVGERSWAGVSGIELCR